MNSSTPVRPRKIAHHGVVEAAGFLFDTRLLSEAEARKRALACWTPGADVYRLSQGILVRLPAPRWINCALSPGTPLILQSGCLLSAPCSDAEIQALAPPPNTVVIVIDGVATAAALHPQDREDPADWIALDAWRAIPLTALGEPPAPPRLVAEASNFDPRSRLPGVPPAAPERSEALNALRLAMQGKLPPEKKSAPSWREHTGHLLERLASRLKAASAGKPSQGAGRPASQKGLGVVPAPPPAGPGLLDLLAQRMNDAAARLLMASGLADQIGRKQAEYVARMMEMFDKGDMDAALRHAIGLADVEEAGGAARKAISLRVPTPRTDLEIKAAHVPARTSLNTGATLFDEMRKLYRKAFEKLEAEGRIDEAAFILAELLAAHEEAAAFLERHGRLKLAAEMAEARNLPPGLIIRLWFLAGDRKRAALIARKTGAFADAVQRMQRIDGARARELRLFWTAALVEQGNYAAAIEVLWPEEDLRVHTLEWLDRVVESGGIAGARMLVRKLTLMSEDDTETAGKARDLLEGEQAEAASERLIFASELLSHKTSFIARRDHTTNVARGLSRQAVRALMRDHTLGLPGGLSSSDWQALLSFSDDSVLRADMPSLPPAPVRTKLIDTTEDTRCEFVDAADTGTLPIYDAALLPNGQTLAAFGETGIKLLTRDGRTVMHWDQPAYRLVLSDQADRAIVLAPRGEVWRIAKLDLVARRAEFWQETHLNAFADSYDGALWFVSVRDDLTAIDALARSFDALWRMPKLEGQILSMARSQSHCSFLLFRPAALDAVGRPSLASLERWTYALPALVLRDRNEVALPAPDISFGATYRPAISSEGSAVYFTLESRHFPPGVHPTLLAEGKTGDWQAITEPGGEWLVLTDPGKGRLIALACSEPEVPLPPVFAPNWILLAGKGASGIVCRLVDRKSWKIRMNITLAGASSLAARFLGSRLTLTDDRGRLLALDLETGDLLRNLRLH